MFNSHQRLMQSLVTLTILGASVYILIGMPSSPADLRTWAATAVGGLMGYWLKPDGGSGTH